MGAAGWRPALLAAGRCVCSSNRRRDRRRHRRYQLSLVRRHPSAPRAVASAEGQASPLAEGDKAAARELVLEGLTRAPHAVHVQVGAGRCVTHVGSAVLVPRGQGVQLSGSAGGQPLNPPPQHRPQPPLPRAAQLCECVRSLVYSDYPEQWPQLLPQVVAGLSSQVRAAAAVLGLQEGAQGALARPPPFRGCRRALRVHLRGVVLMRRSSRGQQAHPAASRPLLALPPQDQQRIRGALVALRFLARKFEFRDEEERGPLEGVVNATFPLLLQIFQVRCGCVGVGAHWWRAVLRGSGDGPRGKRMLLL